MTEGDMNGKGASRRILVAVIAVLAACGGKEGGEDASGEPDAVVDAAPDAAADAVEEGEGGEEGGGEDGADEGGEEAQDAAAEDAEEEEMRPKPPEGCVEGDFQPSWGNIHAHTSYSDGVQEPEDAFAWARDAAGLDVLVITDHLETLNRTPAHWADCREQADAAYAPSSFVADCGFEYSQTTGHINVFFIDDLVPSSSLAFDAFYAEIAACPFCVTQFNHPGWPRQESWHDFAYFADVDAKMNLMEFNVIGEAWDYFFAALEMGWHIAPTLNQDNHSANWGTADDRRTGFFLAALKRPDLHRAMQERRTFMTLDKNASVAMTAQGTCWMGSILKGIDVLSIDVEARDADAGDTFTGIELYGGGRTFIDDFDCAAANPCAARFEVPVTGPTYVVAKVSQADRDWLVAAPIWASPPEE